MAEGNLYGSERLSNAAELDSWFTCRVTANSHRFHQWAIKFFRLTPHSAGKLKSRHENAPLCPQRQDVAVYRTVSSPRRGGRGRVSGQRVAGVPLRPGDRLPFGKPAGSLYGHFGFDGGCAVIHKQPRDPFELFQPACKSAEKGSANWI
jgi:hypothetical protein